MGLGGDRVINLLRDKFSRANMNLNLQFIVFLHTDVTQVVEIRLDRGQVPTHFTYNSQYHGWWWPGDARSQGISNHDIDLVKLE